MPYLFRLPELDHGRERAVAADRGRGGGVFALVVGLPLMRLSGLAAGIATFAVLGITNNSFATTRRSARA